MCVAWLGGGAVGSMACWSSFGELIKMQHPFSKYLANYIHVWMEQVAIPLDSCWFGTWIEIRFTLDQCCSTLTVLRWLGDSGSWSLHIGKLPRLRITDLGSIFAENWTDSSTRWSLNSSASEVKHYLPYFKICSFSLFLLFSPFLNLGEVS